MPKGAKETRNIIEIRDDILYVWNADTYSILILDIAATREKTNEDIPYQVNYCFIIYNFVPVYVLICSRKMILFPGEHYNLTSFFEG